MEERRSHCYILIALFVAWHFAYISLSHKSTFGAYMYCNKPITLLCRGVLLYRFAFSVRLLPCTLIAILPRSFVVSFSQRTLHHAFGAAAARSFMAPLSRWSILPFTFDLRYLSLYRLDALCSCLPRRVPRWTLWRLYVVLLFWRFLSRHSMWRSGMRIFAFVGRTTNFVAYNGIMASRE